MNKKQVEKYLNHYFYSFDFDLNKNDKQIYLDVRDTDYKTILMLKIQYNNNIEKKIIYNKIIRLIKYFDFSYSLEFYDINELKAFWGEK